MAIVLVTLAAMAARPAPAAATSDIGIRHAVIVQAFAMDVSVPTSFITTAYIRTPSATPTFAQANWVHRAVTPNMIRTTSAPITLYGIRQTAFFADIGIRSNQLIRGPAAASLTFTGIRTPVTAHSPGVNIQRTPIINPGDDPAPQYRPVITIVSSPI